MEPDQSDLDPDLVVTLEFVFLLFGSWKKVQKRLHGTLVGTGVCV